MNYLSYKGYTATMEYDAEDHILVGRVQGMKDVVDSTVRPSRNSKRLSATPSMAISRRAQSSEPPRKNPRVGG